MNIGSLKYEKKEIRPSDVRMNLSILLKNVGTLFKFVFELLD